MSRVSMFGLSGPCGKYVGGFFWSMASGGYSVEEIQPHTRCASNAHL